MSREFFEAVRQGNREEVERRLSLDPGLIHATEQNLSPILVAAYQQQTELASFLADKSTPLTIFEASATGRLNQVMRLLARDPELVNTYAGDGFQALGLACYFGYADVAEYLVKAGAPINAPSHNELGAAPLQSAVAAGQPEIVQMLLRHGADPNVREQGGHTPLHAAAQNGDEEMLRILLFGGADLNLRNDENKTPLDLAMQAGHAKATILLGEGITRRFRIPRDES